MQVSVLGFEGSQKQFESLKTCLQKQVGFRKPESLHDHHGGVGVMSRIPASKRVVSSPLNKRLLISTQPVEPLEFPPSLVTDQEYVPSLEQHVSQSDRKANVSIDSRRYVGHGLATRKNIFVQPFFTFVESHTVDMNGAQHENGLFSGFKSEVFDKKLTLSTSNVVFRQSVDASNSHYDKPFEALEDMEAQTIVNLLPDDVDLLPGVFDELGDISQPTNGGGMEEFDLFGSKGGMELVGDDGTGKFIDVVGGSINGQQSGVNGSNVGEHPHGEQTSRTLIARNIFSNVKESELKPLFEQYGDTTALYLAYKHRGFVMISYYDVRAARNTMSALQNKPLRCRKLDIHFSIPKLNTKLCLFDGGDQNQNEDKLGKTLRMGGIRKKKISNAV